MEFGLEGVKLATGLDLNPCSGYKRACNMGYCIESQSPRIWYSLRDYRD
jgi:hypothetical protein